MTLRARGTGTPSLHAPTRNARHRLARAAIVRLFPLASARCYNRPVMSDGDVPVNIRSFTPADQSACNRLYREGLIGGSLSKNDTGADLDDIQACYMRPGNHFWVAEAPGSREIVGMIGVQHHDEGSGEIRRLRVADRYQRRGIGSALVETAIRFCEEHGHLKVTLDTFMEREPAIHLFEKFRFRHFRTRNVAGKDLMYFLLDLYAGDQHGGQHAQGQGHQPQSS
jgi:ribosomal protein S18 acetylase RimI-like enzyme